MLVSSNIASVLIWHSAIPCLATVQFDNSWKYQERSLKWKIGQWHSANKACWNYVNIKVSIEFSGWYDQRNRPASVQTSHSFAQDLPSSLIRRKHRQWDDYVDYKLSVNICFNACAPFVFQQTMFVALEWITIIPQVSNSRPEFLPSQNCLRWPILTQW